MKSVQSLFAFLALTMMTQVGFAKDRYLITFKSEQGQKAMVSVFQLENFGPEVRMQKSLKNIQAIVLKTKNKEALTRLQNHPEVATIEAEFFTPVPRPANGFKIARVIATEMLGRQALQAVNLNAADVPVFKQGPSTPWGIVAVKAGDAWASSGAGSGARVLVLDTGIDKNHPVIATNFEKGQNFTEGDSGDVDAEAFGDQEGHGTHCSGTILGAFNDQDGFTGVAPRAKLLMGRVCGTEGCSNISVAEGINWGIEEKVDVISMSLGGTMTTSSETMAVKKAEQAGVVIVAASGNSAAEPTYSYDKKDPKCKASNPFVPINCGVSFPAAFPTVIAVGALDSSLVKTNFSQWGPELDVTAPGAAVISSVPLGTGRDSVVMVSLNGVQRAIKSSAFSGTKLIPTAVTNSIVVVPGVGKPEDFAKVAIAGKFALVSRGEIKFAEKVQNAIAAKAAGVLIYNNVPGLMQGALTEDGSLLDLPVAMIEQTEGQALVAGLAVGGQATADILLQASDYASFDGTSMATPHVAGVVALMKAANKKLTPAQVREIIKTTSLPLVPNDTNQYGAGAVQADKAVAAAVALAQ